MLDDAEIRDIGEYCNHYFNPEENKKFVNHLDTREDSNKVGIYGECAVGKYFYTPVMTTLLNRPVHVSDPGFDILINDKRWDIKCQVSNNVGKLKESYYMNLPASMLKKDPTGYIWVLKWKDRWDAYWIMGYLTKKEFEGKATLHHKGEKMGDRFTYTNETYDISASKLMPIKQLTELNSDN